MRTVRSRTTAAATVVVGVALAVAGLCLVVLLRRSLVAHVDDVAEARADDVVAAIHDGVLPSAIPGNGDDSTVVQVVDAAGRVVAASDTIKGRGPISSLHPSGTEPVDRTVRIAGVAGGHSARLIAERADGDVVYVASSLEPVDDAVGLLAGALEIGGPLLLALVAATAWVITGRALRPVTVAVEKQRRFVADASHELQTPLASARTDLEVALAHPDRTDWPATGEALLAANGQMERLVQDLLYLARADAGASGRPAGLVDLDGVVLEEAARARPADPVTIDTRAVSAAAVTGPRDDLVRLVRNLIDNALHHARAEVTLRLAVADGHAVLTIADDGAGIAPADRERVFDRFERLDGARARRTGGGGSGLGLAIARDIVVRHRGTIAVADTAAGATFVVTLPTA